MLSIALHYIHTYIQTCMPLIISTVCVYKEWRHSQQSIWIDMDQGVGVMAKSKSSNKKRAGVSVVSLWWWRSRRSLHATRYHPAADVWLPDPRLVTQLDVHPFFFFGYTSTNSWSIHHHHHHHTPPIKNN